MIFRVRGRFSSLKAHKGLSGEKNYVRQKIIQQNDGFTNVKSLNLFDGQSFHTSTARKLAGSGLADLRYFTGLQTEPAREPVGNL